jgi:transcriptional regulator with XRE-family HTH domain
MSGTHWTHKGEKDQNPLHYKECGLDDVYLVGGYEWVDTAHGRGLVIRDLDDLLKAISLQLSMKKSLNGKEVRFLRKQLDVTQAKLARYVGLNAQQVARWEKGESEITESAAAILRLLILDHLCGRVAVRKRLDEIIETDAGVRSQRTLFKKTKEGWQQAEAA